MDANILEAPIFLSINFKFVYWKYCSVTNKKSRNYAAAVESVITTFSWHFAPFNAKSK